MGKKSLLEMQDSKLLTSETVPGFEDRFGHNLDRCGSDIGLKLLTHKLFD